MKDALKIFAFSLCLGMSVFIYGALFHGSEMAVAWVDKAYFAAIGAASAFYFGPRRGSRISPERSEAGRIEK